MTAIAKSYNTSANTALEALNTQLESTYKMKDEVSNKVNDLGNYWTYLNIDLDSSSPYHILCSQNNLKRYEENFNKLFSESGISKADIVKE